MVSLFLCFSSQNVLLAQGSLTVKGSLPQPSECWNYNVYHQDQQGSKLGRETLCGSIGSSKGKLGVIYNHNIVYIHLILI